MTNKKLFFILILVLFIFTACSIKNKTVKTDNIKEDVEQPQLTLKEVEKAIAQEGIKDIQNLNTTHNELEKQPTLSYEEIRLPVFATKKPPKPLPEKKPLDLNSLIKIKDKVLINVERMPLNEFIIHVIGETFKIIFFMEEEVMGDKTPITLKMETPTEPERLFEAIIDIFEKRDIVVEQKAEFLYFYSKKRQPKKPVDIRIGQEVPDSSSEIIQVYPLRYIRANEMESYIKEFFKTGLTLRSYHRENSIILQGLASNIKEVTNFISIFDVPYMQGKRTILLKLTYWQTEDFIKQLTSILTGLGFPVASMPKDPGIYFIPIKYLNSIVVLAPDETSLLQVIEWTKRLDTPESAGTEEKAYIYTPKYSKASDLAESLKNIFATVETTARAPLPTQPTQQQQPQPITPPTAIKGFSTAGLKVSADDRRNLLLIMTTPSQYKNILTYLEKLDQPPKQVLIEAMIAELTLADELKYGFEWLIKNKMLEGSYTLGATFGVPTTPGITYTFLSESQKVKVLINALAVKDLVNILSTPRLMVLDNDEATIQVGTDVPVITGQVTTAEAAGTRTGVVQTIQYRSTGIILRVKPTINTEGLLTIKITQEVSEMGSNPPGITSPTILVRKIDTSVVASSGESIILGGLMYQTESASESKVPLIGDIPLIGELFKSRSKEQRKTELIVILTPKIVSTTQEATRLTEDFKKELKWFEGN